MEIPLLLKVRDNLAIRLSGRGVDRILAKESVFSVWLMIVDGFAGKFMANVNSPGLLKVIYR